jgi:hypothetical protein
LNFEPLKKVTFITALFWRKTVYQKAEKIYLHVNYQAKENETSAIIFIKHKSLKILLIGFVLPHNALLRGKLWLVIMREAPTNCNLSV